MSTRSENFGIAVLTVLAFSDDVQAALPQGAQHLQVQLIMDLLLASALVPMALPARRGRSEATGKVLLTWAVGTALMLLWDVVAWNKEPDSAAALWRLGAAAAGWYIAALVLLLPLADLDLTHVRPAERRSLREGLKPYVPWMSGLAAAYLGSYFWTYYLGRQVGETVDQQFFAQASQIIPVMLIAAGAPYWAARRDASPGPGRFTLVLLCAGEITAVTALIKTSSSTVPLFGAWFQYLTFIVVLFALGAALAVVVDSLLPTAARPPAAASTTLPGAGSGSPTPAPGRNAGVPPAVVLGLGALAVAVVLGRRQRSPRS